MIGLYIEVANKYSNYLYRIFQGIDLSEFTWKVDYEDFFYNVNGEIEQDFFGDREYLNSEEFFRYVSRDNYCMIFADLKAYPTGSDHIAIKSFDDFMISNCSMVFLCYDCAFIEFYCKDEKILKQVHTNCAGDDFEKVEWLDIDDVFRSRMSVW